MSKTMTGKQFTRKLKDVLAAMSNNTKMWETIGKKARDDRKKIIYSKKDTLGNAFVPLKPETVKRKRAQGDGDPLKPLVGATRKLMDAEIVTRTGGVKLVLDPKVAYHSSDSRANGVPLRKTDTFAPGTQDKATEYFTRIFKTQIRRKFGE